MRLFVAIDVPEETQQALRAIINDLAPICRGARWVRTEGIHVTLKFIGHVDDALLPRIEEALSNVHRERPIAVAFREFGFFPNERHPRVFFVGIQVDKEFESLAKEVEDRLEPMGIAKEGRAFCPHLTLARFKTNEGMPALRKRIASLPSQDFGISDVKEFYLYQSVLKSSGAVYTKLSTYSL